MNGVWHMNHFNNFNIRNRCDSTCTDTWFEVLSELVSETERFLKTAPKGAVWASKRKNGSFQYYYVQPGTRNRVYIRRKDMTIARELAQKQYVCMLNRMAVTALDRLKVTGLFSEKDLYYVYDEAYYRLSEGIRLLVRPWKETRDVFFEKWAAQTYEPLECFAEERTQVSDRGELMGSKSEVMIGNALNRRNIMYHYEKPLLLGRSKKIRPDFTLIDIFGRRELFWEHLGIVDKEHYAFKAMRKIMTYERNEIFINDRLILTYETARDQLNLRTINETIDQIEHMLK